MCGIAGIVDFHTDTVVEQAELERMAMVLAHRGPDDSGVYIDPDTHRCGLAHRRLEVIDPAGGPQPLANEDRTLWITYNGECYNFADLRRDLVAKGHHFQTQCDTEVVVHLYQEYGRDCVEYMRGMFAFAIWNNRRQQLFLARDRLGQKPLYYGVHKGRFIFASECKAILESADFPRRPDPDAIGHYLLLQYVPFPQSAFADIQQLPPAHVMTIDETNYGQPSAQRYWSIPTEPAFTGDFSEACQQVRTELTAATRMRMISDVPLGAFLSGGIDSAIIVGVMSEKNPEVTQTCTIGFQEKIYNELPLARQVANRFGCEHREFVVEPDCTETIDKLSYFYDEPFADCSALPTFHLSHLARSQVTVALTGDGSDECFGGYDRYRALRLSEWMNRRRFLNWLIRRKLWQNMAAGEHRSRRRQLKRFVTAAALPVARRYLKWVTVFHPDILRELLADDAFLGQVPDQHWDYLTRYFAGPAEHIDFVGRAMVADGSLYLPGDLNAKIDRASMSIGLELRCPFQDHKVVELAYSLPTRWRSHRSQGKYLLRQAFADLLPPAIARQPKRGFSVPVGRWFRNELREKFVDTVLSPRALQRGYFHSKVIRSLLDQNDRKQEDHGHRLWSLLMLELWHRRYIDR